MKIFGGGAAKVTYVTPIPENLVPWDSHEVQASFRDWSKRVFELPSVRSFWASGASPETKSKFWNDLLLRATDEAQSNFAIDWLQRRIVDAQRQVDQTTALVADMKTQLADMQQTHSERYRDSGR